MKINYKSDFDFILDLKDSQGESIGWPLCDFCIELTTVRGMRGYRAYCIGGETLHCFNDNGRLHVVCDHHGLAPGQVVARVTLHNPSAMYPDGLQDLCLPIETGIELVTGLTEVPVDGVVEVSLPVLVKTAYEMAVAAGYGGTEQEYTAAVASLVETVAEARQTLETSQAAAQTAAEAAESAQTVVGTAQGAVDAAVAATGAANDAASVAAEAAVQASEAAVDASAAAAEAREAAAPIAGRQVAVRDEDNGWRAQQTFFGDVVLRGNLIQLGAAYEVQAQVVTTSQDMIVLREGAVGGVPAGSFVGLCARLYNGEDDGFLVYDHEGARVGKQGDTEPLLTRAEKREMAHGEPLVWDAVRNRAVSGAWPQLPQMRTVEMEVTYDDDTTETFNLYAAVEP